jgi:hypothetical protein
MTHPGFAVPVLAIVATIALITVNKFKRVASAAISTPSTTDDSLARLDERIARFEQAMDAIAVEVERIGEGQRFLTRLLAERPMPASSRPGP